MADPATGLERSFDPSVYTPVVGGERAVDRGSPAPAPADAPITPPARLVQLVKLAAAKQEAGEDGEAQELFRQALEIADRTLEPNDPDVVLLLTDLTRLYLRKSAFDSAEPLLLRLFEIKRSKGDDHPEVGTVLASLATVRQALGRHESAEQLWRRVLEIRELTLAPNHFAIATALEHLANSCAARGKIAEALSAFQRALSIREKTLGVDHPSLRISRERIADLRLQGSEDPFELGLASDSVATPEKYRLLAGEPVRTSLPEPPAPRPAPPPTKERATASSSRKAPQVLERAVAERFVEPEAPRQVAVMSAAEAAPLTVILPHPVAPQSEPVPYLDALESLRDELEEPSEQRTFAERSSAMISTAMTFLGRKEAIVGMVAVVIGLLSVAVVTDSQAVSGRDQEIAQPAPVAEVSKTPFSASTATPAGNEAAAVAAAVDLSNRAAASRPRPTEDRPSATRKTPDKAADKKLDTKPLTIPALSTSVISRLDELANKTSSASNPVTDAMFSPSPAPVAAHRSGFDDADATTVPLRARLIGDLPTPRIPQQVADVEGEVRVRFSVDTEGRPVMSTLDVLTSPNPLLTAAVRKVIPTLHFEPARTGGSDPKPIPDVVQIGFQFSRGK